MHGCQPACLNLRPIARFVEEIQLLLVSAMHAYGLSTYYAFDLGGAVRKDRARVEFRTDVYEDVEQRAPGNGSWAD